MFCSHAECYILVAIMLNILMLSVIMLSVVTLSVVLLSVVMLSVVVLSVVRLIVVAPSKTFLSNLSNYLEKYKISILIKNPSLTPNLPFDRA